MSKEKNPEAIADQTDKYLLIATVRTVSRLQRLFLKNYKLNRGTRVYTFSALMG